MRHRKYVFFHAPSLLSVALTAVLAACTGSIGGTREGNSEGAGPGTNGPGGAVAPGGVEGSLAPDAPVEDLAGPMPLQRLSRLEYANTVRDLMGDVSGAALGFPADGVGPSGFDTPGIVSDVEARGFQDAAERLAANAVKNLTAFLTCDPANGESTCITQFLRTFGKRAYRRSLLDAELSDLQGFFTAARASHDLATSVGLVVQAMLQSPKFLYHWQLGSQAPNVENGLIKLNGYELASRLSYFLWRTMPDDDLMSAADSGKLSTLEGLTAQATRLLNDARAHDAISDFHVQWLALRDFDQLEKDSVIYPEYNSALALAMLDETRAFASSVILSGDGRLASLFTSTSTFLNEPLAKLYGVTGVSGATFVKANLDATQRAGILTQASFLTAQATAVGSHPIRRGKLVWENVICGAVPPPPPNVPPPQPVSPNLSTRERFAQHAENACAKGCHALFDPPGFAFESYDGIGRFRTMDGGQPVDASDTVKLPLDGAKSFRDAVELAKILATSEDARQCAVRQWSRYALRRHEVDAEAGSLKGAYADFREMDFNVRSLLVRVVTMKTFQFRAAASGEVVQ